MDPTSNHSLVAKNSHLQVGQRACTGLRSYGTQVLFTIRNGSRRPKRMIAFHALPRQYLRPMIENSPPQILVPHCSVQPLLQPPRRGKLVHKPDNVPSLNKLRDTQTSITSRTGDLIFLNNLDFAFFGLSAYCLSLDATTMVLPLSHASLSGDQANQRRQGPIHDGKPIYSIPTFTRFED